MTEELHQEEPRTMPKVRDSESKVSSSVNQFMRCYPARTAARVSALYAY